MAEKPKTAKPADAAKRSASSPGEAQASSVAKAAQAKARAEAPAIPYTPEDIAEIFRRFAMQRPDPRPELEHSNAFTLLVAVVLSAQATDAGVNRATRGLFARADNPAAMAALGEAEVAEAIRTIGLYRNKAKNVVALSKALVERHAGAVPHDRDALEALPGVGRKTANVVLNSAFGEETLAVDTHIFRLGNRLKIAPGKTPDAVERGFLKIIPPGALKHAHHWILLHGRYVCKARRPDCGICVIADLCRADERWNAVPAPLVPLPVLPSGFQGAPDLRVSGSGTPPGPARREAAGPRRAPKRAGGDAPSARPRKAASGD